MFDISLVLAKRKKLVLGFPLSLSLLAVVVSLLMPNVYQATATLMPPQQQQSSATAFLSQLGGAAGLAGAVTGLKNPSELYVGMLRSRTIADRIVARFKLREVYDVEFLETARKQLAADTAISAGKDGLISISVENKNQKMVAPMVQAYIDELDALTKNVAVTEAARRRIFYEQQLKATNDQLAQAEAKLKSGIESNGLSSAEGDSRAAVETTARLRAQVSAKEIQLGSLRAFLTADNPEYRRVQEELNSLRAELSRLENGSAAASQNKVAGAGSTPAGLENVKLLRDVKYYQMLYEMLAKQYEVARLDESKDSTIIQVLDKPIEPERKYRPMRALIVLATAFISFFIACVVALLSEQKARLLSSPRQAAKWASLKAYLRFR